MKAIDMTGQRFGRLLVIARADNRRGYRRTAWLCRCDCGTEKVIEAYNLRHGTTKSCGCIQAPKLNPEQALALWQQGKSLEQIRDELAPGASVMAASRAVRRAVKAGGVRTSHRKEIYEPRAAGF